MDKDVAKELWQYAASRQAREYAIWLKMPSRTAEKAYEAQRLRVAAWATAAQELYALAHKQEQPV